MTDKEITELFEKLIEHDRRMLDLQERVVGLLESLDRGPESGRAEDVTELKQQVGTLQAHLINLYLRLGHPNPYDTRR